MKKKYYVDVHYEVILPTEVIAESEQEAIDMAIEELTDEDLNDGEVISEVGKITDVESVEPEEKPSSIDDFFKSLGIMGGFGGFYTSEEDKKAFIKFIKLLAEELDKK